MQNYVEYAPSQTDDIEIGFGLLELTNANHIRLTKVNEEGQSTNKVLFDITPQQIEECMTNRTYLGIGFSNIHYGLDFGVPFFKPWFEKNNKVINSQAGQKPAVSASVKFMERWARDTMSSTPPRNETNIDAWVTYLERSGVKVSNLHLFGKNGVKIWAWIIGGVVAFAIFLLLIFSFAASSA
jgi:hypothetical protein